MISHLLAPRQGVQIKLSGPPSDSGASRGKPPEDAVSLRAALADPSGPRVHSPGEVAEHFRRLSEMKRRFRRPEFGGPGKRRSASRRCPAGSILFIEFYIDLNI